MSKLSTLRKTVNNVTERLFSRFKKPKTFRLFSLPFLTVEMILNRMSFLELFNLGLCSENSSASIRRVLRKRPFGANCEMNVNFIREKLSTIDVKLGTASQRFYVTNGGAKPKAGKDEIVVEWGEHSRQKAIKIICRIVKSFKAIRMGMFHNIDDMRKFAEMFNSLIERRTSIEMRYAGPRFPDSDKKTTSETMLSILEMASNWTTAEVFMQNGIEIKISSKGGNRVLCMDASQREYGQHMMRLDFWSLGYDRIKIGRNLSQPLLQSNLGNWRPEWNTLEVKAEVEKSINIPELLSGSSLEVSVTKHPINGRTAYRVRFGGSSKEAMAFIGWEDSQRFLKFIVVQ